MPPPPTSRTPRRRHLARFRRHGGFLEQLRQLDDDPVLLCGCADNPQCGCDGGTPQAELLAVPELSGQAA